MDFFTLEKLVAELSSGISEKPVVTRVFAGPGRSFSMRLKFRQSWSDLVFNLDNPSPGIWLADRAAEIDAVPSIVRTANRLLVNSRLISIGMLQNSEKNNFDRVIELAFLHIDGMLGRRSNFFIIAELTGRFADIFLCNSRRVIMERIARTSNNLVSEEYSLPDSSPLLDPMNTDAEKLNSIFSAPADDWKHYIGGMSPKLSSEIQSLAAATDCSKLSAMRELVQSCRHRAGAWIYHNSENLRQLTVSGYRLTSLAHLREKEFASVNAALAWVEQNLVAARRINELKSRALQTLNKELKHKLNLLNEQQKLSEKFHNHEHYRKTGELLTANLYQIKPGQPLAQLQDWTTNETISIELDPSRTPAANAARFFNLARKYKRGVVETHKRIQALKSDVSWLKEQIWLTESAENENDIYIPQKKGSDRSKKTQAQKPKGNRAGAKPYFPAILEIDGARYFVGRNARQNDIVTFQVARRGDYWFHANDVPGAHVILKKIEGELTDADLCRGASLAAWFSFARESSKVAVDTCEVSFVKRIPGGAPGRVSYSHQKTIMIDPAIARDLLETTSGLQKKQPG